MRNHCFLSGCEDMSFTCVIYFTRTVTYIQGPSLWLPAHYGMTGVCMCEYMTVPTEYMCVQGSV